MSNDNMYSNFYRATMTGLFLGIADTLICIIFAYVYRSITDFQNFALINYSFTIFASNVLLTSCGIIYFYFTKIRHGDLWYGLIFLLLMGAALWGTQSAVISDVHSVSVIFRGMLSGYLLIYGLSAALGIPFLYHGHFLDKTVI